MNKALLIAILLISIVLALYLVFQGSSGDIAVKKPVFAPQFISDYKKTTGHLPTQQEVVNALKQ